MNISICDAMDNWFWFRRDLAGSSLFASFLWIFIKTPYFCHQTYRPSGRHSCFVFGRSQIQISALIPVAVILTEAYRGFRQSLQAKGGIEPHIRPRPLASITFPILAHYQQHRSTVHFFVRNLATTPMGEQACTVCPTQQFAVRSTCTGYSWATKHNWTLNTTPAGGYHGSLFPKVCQCWYRDPRERTGHCA
jgi:hypothetical protein